jgi:hypothetical protein
LDHVKHFLRRTCLLFLAIVAPLSADGLIPPLDSKQAQQARKTIEEFKTNPKGPYFQIRWFSDKTRPAQTAEDILLDLASRMDSDGGMPGENRESRASATVIALLAFLSQGHTHAWRFPFARGTAYIILEVVNQPPQPSATDCRCRYRVRQQRHSVGRRVDYSRPYSRQSLV